MNPADAADEAVCRLITTGRVTGRPHDIEMWFGVVGGAFVFIAGNGPGADWYRNAVSAGSATVRVAGVTFTGRARSAHPDEREAVGAAMTAKYGGWGGDPSIGLSEHAWTWSVPALIVEDLRVLGQ